MSSNVGGQLFFVPPGLQAQIHTLDVESMFLSLTVGLYISFASFLFVRRGGAMPLSSFFDGADDGDESDHSEVKQRRKRQTEKARIALAASRATRKAEREAESASASAQTPFSLTANSATPRAAQDLQKKFLTGRLHYTHAMSQGFENILQPDQKKANHRGRARCVYSLLRAIAQVFEALFPSSQASPDTAVQCIINTIVPDDTNTRLKGPGRGDRSLVHTVMNVVQSCVVYYEKPLSDGHNWHCFSLPCPVSILKVANTEHIHAAYASYLIAGAAGLGQRWKALGISSSVTDAIANGKWIVQLMCGDALEANSSAFRLERQLLAVKRAHSSDNGWRTVAIRFKCLNHQVGLVRKPIVLGIGRYWATLVRLSHLYECAAFRRRFTAAMVSLVQKPGVFQCSLTSTLSLCVLVSLTTEQYWWYSGSMLSGSDDRSVL